MFEFIDWMTTFCEDREAKLFEDEHGHVKTIIIDHDYGIDTAKIFRNYDKAVTYLEKCGFRF